MLPDWLVNSLRARARNWFWHGPWCRPCRVCAWTPGVKPAPLSAKPVLNRRRAQPIVVRIAVVGQQRFGRHADAGPLILVMMWSAPAIGAWLPLMFTVRVAVLVSPSLSLAGR
jgi:hypothetical protein